MIRSSSLLFSKKKRAKTKKTCSTMFLVKF